MGVCRGARPLQGSGLHGRHAGHGRHLSSLGAAGGQVRLAGNENSINEIAIRIFYLIQSVFYTAGASCLLWCVVWFFLVTDDPEDHPLISEEELKVAKYRASRHFLKNRSEFGPGDPIQPGGPRQGQVSEDPPLVNRSLPLHLGPHPHQHVQRLRILPPPHRGAELPQERPQKGHHRGEISLNVLRLFRKWQNIATKNTYSSSSNRGGSIK